MIVRPLTRLGQRQWYAAFGGGFRAIGKTPAEAMARLKEMIGD